MSGGEFIKKPDRRVKLLILIQGLWVSTLIVLILWWSTVIRQKSDEIASLQTQLNVPEAQIQNKLERTERMIQGESGSLLLIILITNGILFFFYVRDHRRSKSLQAFFASVTHELRTPLTSIKLQAEALRDIEDNPKHTPFLNRLLEDVERLEGQVQKTLELARLEGGGSLNTQPVQLRSFFQSRFLGSYHSNETKIKVSHDLADGFVIADTAALSIILRNIFDNAIRYSQVQPAQLSVIGKAASDHYSLIVTHSNSQFEGDTQHLGKLFYRGTNSQGAGVGLYLIETLMEKMKGKVAFVTSNSTFVTQLTFGVDHGA
jgi:signal transduction histidine kinase